ncbi:MAG: hypothetical protein OEN02_02410 [Gammaproteobacteria bacterium]|nr:hypothetical protein [Gammaproteobacteria bacterium]MDH3536561.1 hypothetical protein [Gammaproteobacteria bacterium]
MNNYEDWAQLVAKKLAGEADIIAAIDKDELEDAAAADAFISAVLEPFLPENFGVGSGRIVDAFGNYSDHLDVIVYNRDFPRIGLRGTHSAYLYESVLAVFNVRAKFIRKTFFECLNACASMAQLETNIDKAVLIKLAKKNGLKPGPNKRFIHRDPLRTARFELIGRPPAFVFGFNGMKYSYRQLQENIELWIKGRQEEQIETPMKSLPAVIATQGCFAWRNAAPLALSNREMLGIGNDDAPIRLVVLQMLYLLNRRLNVTADGYGLKPSLNAYLSQFSAPKFEIGVGDVAEIFDLEQSKAGNELPDETTQGFARARDHAPAETAAAVAAAPMASPATKPEEQPAASTVPEVPQQAAASAVPEAPQQPAVFDKPSPFASAPIPPAQPSNPTGSQDSGLQSEKGSGVFDKPSPFASAPVKSAAAPVADEPQRSPAPIAPLGSAPIPPMQNSAPPAPTPPNPPVSTPLGSAPIPPMQSSTAETRKPDPEPVTAKVIPPKPPVDIELGFGSEPAAADDKPDEEEDEFINTVIIPPNAGATNQDKSRNSTDAFIARVKQQLSTSEALPENEKDFSSTIPQ